MNIKSKIMTLIIIITIIFLFPGVAFADPYPPPDPTPTPISDLPPDILNTFPECTTLPPENNLCAYGFSFEGSGLPRWYLVKDGPIDPHPTDYNYCIIWTNVYGNHLDRCLELTLIRYFPTGGINGSGRNVYASDWFLICGGGYINFDVWMTNIHGEIIYADIIQPNSYFLFCRFFPHTSRIF